MLSNQELRDDFAKQFAVVEVDMGAPKGKCTLSDFISAGAFESIFRPAVMGDRVSSFSALNQNTLRNVIAEFPIPARRAAVKFATEFSLTNGMMKFSDTAFILPEFGFQALLEGNYIEVVSRGTADPKNTVADIGEGFSGEVSLGHVRGGRRQHAGNALSEGDWAERTAGGRRPTPEGGRCVFDKGQSAGDWNRGS